MTRTKLGLCLALIGAVGACGGRSGLRVLTRDGGGVGDVSADGRLDGGGQDGRFEVGLASDARIEVGISDARTEAGTSDARTEVGTSDVRTEVGASDVRTEAGTSEVRVADVALDVRPEAGGPDVPRDGAIDVRVADGRPDVSTPTDTPRDLAGDTAPTLSSIEISPASPTVHIGTPLSVVITAIYADGSTADVSASATVTSGATSILTVSGATLTGVAAGTATITATYQGRTATATVTVVAQPLQSISIGSVGTINVGQLVKLLATGVFADGSKQDVTSQATWGSSDASIASVGNTSTTKGQLTGVAVGTATVTASIQTISGTLQVTVASSPIASIQITPTQPILPQSVTQPFQATATYANNTTGDVTLQATWSTGDTGVLTVVATGANAGRATAVAAGTTTITATIGAVTGRTSVTVIASPLTSITVAPATATITVHGTKSFTATGNYANGTTADLTASVTWSSSNTAVLSVSNATATRGLATGVAAGTANVQAAFQGVTGTAAVTVSPATLISVAVKPNPLNLPLLITSPLAATGTYGVAGDPSSQFTQDVTTSATWTVADSSIATVGNSATTAGEVTGTKVGSTIVTATLSGISGSTTVTVNQATLLSIAVTPATASVTAGTSQPFTATGSYDNNTTTDLTTMATWSSSNIAVAEVSNAAGSNGVAATLVRGTATITATYQGKQGTAALTVGSPVLVAIAVTPATASIVAGNTQAYAVRGVYANGTTGPITGVSWSSSSVAVATIAAGGGGGGRGGGATATGVAAGTTTITASYGTDAGTSFSDTATLTVTAAPQPRTPIAIRLTPASATIQVNGAQPYTVNVDYDNGTTAAVTAGVTLTTSSGTVAAVAGGGRGGPGGLLVNGVGAGTATVTATYTTGGQTFTDTATLTVTAATQAPTQVGLYITPATAAVDVDGTQQFVAHATFSDGTDTVVTGTSSWTTSDGTLATVTSAVGGRGAIGGAGGLATGLAAGTVTINASSGGFSATAILTVTAPPSNPQVGLYVTPATISVDVNGTQQFQAYATYQDGTSTAVTNNASTAWGTSAPTVATITNPGGATGRGGVFGGGAGGLATGLAAGTVTVNASFGGFSATATLTVTAPPVLKSLVVTPATASIHVGQNQAFVATAVYNDGTSAAVTGTATWGTSDATIAVMTAPGGGRGAIVVGGGAATGLAVGNATVSASYTENGITVSGTAALAVTQAVLLSLEVTPTNPTVYLSTSPNQAFVATAIYTDYTTANVTASADWSSSNAAVAVISDSGATIGRATGLAVGTTTITAAFGGTSASTTLTVASKKVTTIQVTPTTPTAHLGINQSFVATAVYDDSSTSTVTGSATWTSSDNTVATVGTAGGSAGVATPIKAGKPTVTATYQGVSGSTTLTVSGAVLSSIAITPSPLSVVVGGHQQLTATGTWADSTTADITNNVTWLSSSDAIATVSNAAGSRGLFTAVSAGSVTVTAAFQGVTGTLVGTVAASH